MSAPMNFRSLIIGVVTLVVVSAATWGVATFRSVAPPLAERQASATPRPEAARRADTASVAGAIPASPPPSTPVAAPPATPQPAVRSSAKRDYEVQSATDDDSTANVFPWPPPAPSTSYQLPNSLFASAGKMGDVARSIDQALESTGYVERRYYKLPVDGLALVTRLERVNDDGSPGAPRWMTSDGGRTNLYLLVRGLFVTDPGHYRVIVFFITKDLPGRKPEDVPIAQAKSWLKGGLDDVPADAGALPYANGRTIAYIYDFVSNGRTFVLDREPMPGKDQLTKAGVLTALSGGGK